MKKILLIGGIGLAAWWFLGRRNGSGSLDEAGANPITNANETDGGGSRAKDVIRAGANVANSAVDFFNAMVR